MSDLTLKELQNQYEGHQAAYLSIPQAGKCIDCDDHNSPWRQLHSSHNPRGFRHTFSIKLSEERTEDFVLNWFYHCDECAEKELERRRLERPAWATRE